MQRPLVAKEPPNRDPGNFQVSFAAANSGTSSVPGLTHLAFAANDALTESHSGIAPAAPEVEAGERCQRPGVNCSLYEWLEGQLRLISVLPGNTVPASRAVIGSGQLVSGQESSDVDHAISDDGSRIFWSSEESGQVYARVDGATTLEVPGPNTCKQGIPLEERTCFLTASTDGSVVLLSDGEVAELNEAGDEYHQSADLTLDEGNIHQGGFQGILGAAEDLSRVYFVDTKALTGENAEHKSPNENGGEEDNLYVWNKAQTKFIGTLVAGDGAFAAGNFSYGAWQASPSLRTAQVSRDGRYLVFMSLAALTGYDSRHRGGGECGFVSAGPVCRQIFEYSTGSENLSCVSCNPTGEQPIGSSALTLIRPDGPFLQPHNLSPVGNGRVFFQSLDVLSPRDTNGGIQDVYEWEPNGTGSCKRAGGCVSLISSGHSPNDSMFVDSSSSGGDAFFITREQLLPSDKDQQLDLYDARAPHGAGEPVGFPEPAVSSCEGEDCAGPITSPPAQDRPATFGFIGPGNFALSLTPPPNARPKPPTRAQKLAKALKACAKKPRSRRHACKAQAMSRYGPIKAKSKSKSHKGGN